MLTKISKNLEIEVNLRERPRGGEVEDAMQAVYYFLENSDEKCQFTMEELMEQIEGDFRLNPCTIRRHLLQKYSDQANFTLYVSEPLDRKSLMNPGIDMFRGFRNKKKSVP
ncbi:hypothetical protein JTB14_029954 [Gonioctena quinquepunctata]|nr:hypothetical protein JTB14_029954 [Gonioctena quinquepunctata]